MSGAQRPPAGTCPGDDRYAALRPDSGSVPAERPLRDWANAGAEPVLAGGGTPEPVTVAEWTARWQAARVVEPTTAAVAESRLRTHVLPRWRDQLLTEVRPSQVQEWVRGLQTAGLGPASISGVHGLLATIMRAAVRDGLLPTSPCEYTRLPPVPRGREVFLTREQVQAITAAVSERDALVVRFLSQTGLRWGEMAGLPIRHLDLPGARVHVCQVATEIAGAITLRGYPKSAMSRRSVPLPHELVTMLQPQLGCRHGEPDALVFTGARGAPLSPSRWRARVWAKAVAGFDPRPSPHQLRHSYASWLVQAGVDLYVVRALLGHSSIRTTQRYAHLADQQLRAAVETAFAPPVPAAEPGGDGTPGAAPRP